MTRFLVAFLVGVVLASAPERSLGQTREIQDYLKLILDEIKKRDAAYAKEIQALRGELEAVKKELSKQATSKQAASKGGSEDLAARLAEAEKRAREAEATAKMLLSAMQARNLQLQAQVQQQEKEIARLQALLKEGKAAAAPDKPNPPRALVKGKVTKVEAEADLVEVNVGEDHGLKAGHTLEVYRLSPKPEFLGTIRLVQVTPQRSVGRLVLSNPLKKATIKVGDDVSSRLE